MKYIMCQPATRRFEWELEVSVTRLQKLGVKNIVLLFSRADSRIPLYFKSLGCEVHVYNDLRKSKLYIPSIKPYLWIRYLEEDPNRQNDSYFYMDSDVIFREIPKVEPSVTTWYGSNCDHYLSAEYIDSKGEGLLEKMCDIVGVSAKDIRARNAVAGAQWVFKCPTIDYWTKVYEDSVALYDMLSRIENEYVARGGEGYVPIQKWTAEMWAQLWNIYYFCRDVEVHPELEFCWPTDDISRYDEVKILHNAGVVDANKGLFFKGKYITTTPYYDDLSFVDKSKAGWEYVKAIEEVKSKKFPGGYSRKRY